MLRSFCSEYLHGEIAVGISMALVFDGSILQNGGRGNARGIVIVCLPVLSSLCWVFVTESVRVLIVCGGGRVPVGKGVANEIGDGGSVGGILHEDEHAVFQDAGTFFDSIEKRVISGVLLVRVELIQVSKFVRNFSLRLGAGALNYCRMAVEDCDGL